MRRIFAVSLLFVLVSSAPTGCAGTLPGTRAATQSERIPDDRELAPVVAEGCGSEASLRSVRYDKPTSIRFRNATTHDITYYWINYEGVRDQKRTLKAGEAEDRTTFVTHPFVVVDSRDACVAVYMPLEKHGLVVVTDPPK